MEKQKKEDLSHFLQNYLVYLIQLERERKRLCFRFVGSLGQKESEWKVGEREKSFILFETKASQPIKPILGKMTQEREYYEPRHKSQNNKG